MSSHFCDRAAAPDDDALAAALGATKPLWDALHAEVARVAGVAMTWKFYGAKHGWQVKALRKKKALAYLIPHAGSFLIGMALRDAAVEAVRASDLPTAVVAEIVDAKPLPEGRPARVEVRSAADLRLASRLLALAV